MSGLGTDTTRHAERLRREMVAGMVAAGHLVSPTWRAAFEQVPRHTFVPSFYVQTPASQRLVDHRIPDEWISGVYQDRPLVLSPDARASSTAPSLMAAMLQALEPEDGHQVLEIGAGSGYHAALLCHRLGDQHVTTVDIDPDLVEHARERLRDAGYRPTVVTGDGAAGWPDKAAYDRLIATCAVDAVPRTWLAQVRSGGRIVTPIATGVAALTVDGPEGATGRFLPEAAYFMPLRSETAPSEVSPILRTVAQSSAPARPTSIGPDVWFDNGFRFLLAATVPGLRHLTRDPDSGAAIFSHPDGSWAKLIDDQVTQGGPRSVWDAVERARRQWDELGHPGRENFTLTVAGAVQQIRLTGTPQAWTLPPCTPGRAGAHGRTSPAS